MPPAGALIAPIMIDQTTILVHDEIRTKRSQTAIDHELLAPVDRLRRLRHDFRHDARPFLDVRRLRLWLTCNHHVGIIKNLADAQLHFGLMDPTRTAASSRPASGEDIP